MEAGQTTEETLFYSALEFASRDAREAHVRQLCGGDKQLLTRVMALLEADCLGDGFLEEPPTFCTPPIEESESQETVGAVIGRYRLLQQIGEGGMATVYLARREGSEDAGACPGDLEPSRHKVALKIIKPGMDTRHVIARFEAERQALAMMDHPSIAKVLDAGATERGRPYFVMELVAGVSITEYCDRHRLSIRERLALFVEVCKAVQHAHQKGIIHRDLKPSNVMVTHCDGRPMPKVIDFGIAKAVNQRLTERTLFTRYGQIVGTPAYMSPEQAEFSDGDIDTRSDVYSLGVLLYELLTGTTPFSKEELHKAGYAQIQRIIREREPAKPSAGLGTAPGEVADRRSSTPDLLTRTVRGELDWIVMKALEKDRGRRYDSSSALLSDVQRYLDHEPVLAGPPTARYRAKKFLQRHRVVATAAALVATTVMAGLGVSVALYVRAEKARAGESAARAEAQAVTDFLTKDLLASVYPEKVRNREVTVRYILESASRDLDHRFLGSPLAEAQVRETLGLTYQKMGDYPAALPHLERALELRRARLGEEHPVALASLNQLGILYRDWGRYQQAEPLLSRALDARGRVLGGVHRDTLESMSDLAWQYMSEARFTEGVALAERAVEIGRRVLREEDPIVLRAIAVLAAGRVTAMRYEQAESLAGKGYETSVRVLGEEDETSLLLGVVLAWAYEQRGQVDRAADVGGRTLKTSRQVLGEDRLITMWAARNMGAVFIRQGRFDQALPLLTESFERARRLFGEARSATVMFGFTLAGLYRAQQRYPEYEALLVRMMEASRVTHGDQHPQTGYLRYHLRIRLAELRPQGLAHYSSGHYEEAADIFARCGEMRRVLYGRPSPSEIGPLAVSLHRLGREPEARTQLERLRAMYEDGEHAYEEAPLHEAESQSALEGSEASETWQLMGAGQLDKASAIVMAMTESGGESGEGAAPDRQRLAKALARAYCRRAAEAEVGVDHAAARDGYEAGARVCPGYAVPLQRLAWFYATCPVDGIRNGSEAVILATRACELTCWENPGCLEALAAACAEARDFGAAVKWQKKATELLGADAHPGMRAAYAERLHLYESGRAFHTRGERSLVARWTFDEAVAGRVADASGHGLDAMLVGDATLVLDDQRGSVLRLGGQGHVDCGASKGFDLTGPMTVMAWIKTDAFTKPHQGIVGKGSTAWRLQRLNDTGVLHFGCSGIEMQDDDPLTLAGHTEVADGQWHHVAAVYDGTRMCMVLDGRLDSEAGAGGIVSTNDQPVWVGAFSDAPGFEWSGWIDDVRVYDYALTEAEVKAVHAETGLKGREATVE